MLAPPAAQHGHFGTLDLDLKRHGSGEEGKLVRKRRKRADMQIQNGCSALPLRLDERLLPSLPIPVLPPTAAGLASFNLNPAEVLAVASFHIRRIAAMTIRADPTRLSEVLRYRQWSCVSFALDRVGRSACLDKALLCVASKLQQMTGGSVTSLSVLSSYTQALGSLQAALQSPEVHDALDLLTTTQLLAIYELLDSPESGTWNTHVAGVEGLLRVQSAKHRLPFAQIAPMLTDALLKGDFKPVESSPWRQVLEAVVREDFIGNKQCQELISCLSELPAMLAEGSSSSGETAVLDWARTYTLLGKAHELKGRLRKALLDSQLYSENTYNALASFDVLGLCLAGLLALDKLMTSLGPKETAREAVEDKTNELCAQLLQLELRASDGYPANDIMSAFQMLVPGAFVIALPGRSDE